MRRRQVSRTQTTSLARRFAPVTSKKYFLPTSLPGCQLWLDAADSSSVITTGTNVTTWRDKSGNGYHMNTLTQTAGWSGTAEYPTIGTSINGLQTVNFKAQGGLKQATTLDGVKNLFWVGRIAAPTGSGGANSYFLFGHDTHYDWHATPYGGRFVDYVNVQGGIYNGTTSLFTSDSSAVTNTTLGLAFTPTAPSISLLSVTGITGTTRYQGICYDRNGGHIGWCGDLAEVITFSTALSTAQHQAVEGYLAHKWGITKYYSPATPLTIPGCSIWLDAADTSSLTLSGSTVTTWKDKSGNANNFTSVIGSTSILTDNGMNVVNFSANDAVMRSTNQVPLTTSSAIFVVSKLLSVNSSTFSYILALPDILGWDDYSFRYRDGSSLIGTRAYGGGGIDGEIGYNNYYVNGVFDPATGGQFLNKYSVISTIKPGRSGTTSVLLSSSSSGRYFKGYIAEFLYYSGGVTLSQRATIENYLMQKWGLTRLLPLSHPYNNFIPSPLTEFIPKSITGCALWLDGADTAGTGVRPANGTTISTWVDKSASGANLTAVGTPTYASASSSVYLNGNSYLQNTNFNFTNHTMFIVSVQSTGPGPLYTTNRSTAVSGFFPNYQGSYYLAQANNSWLFTSSPFVDGTTYLYSIQYDSLNNINVWSNGNTSPTISSTAGTITRNQFILGKRDAEGSVENMTGNIFEVVQFSTDLTTTQRQQVEGYLAWKWRLTGSLPAGHPYKSFSPFPVISINFLPTLIPGCQLWLDGDDPLATGIKPINGAIVSSWRDKSGNARHGTKVNNPAYNLSRRALHFTGTEYYTLPDSTFPSGNSSYTYFMIVNFTSFSSGGVLAGGGFTGSDSIGFRPNGPGGGFYAYWFGNDIYSSTTYNINEVVSIVSFFNSPTSSRTLIQNFTTTTTAGGGRNQPPTNNTVGKSFGGEFMIGYIHEVIVYDSSLSTTQRQQVESYLAWKWALQTSLPSDHTYKFAPPSV